MTEKGRIMTEEALLARITREFLSGRDTCHFRLGSVAGMKDADVLDACRMYCMESGSGSEYEAFIKKAKAEYVLCEKRGEYFLRTECGKESGADCAECSHGK